MAGLDSDDEPATMQKQQQIQARRVRRRHRVRRTIIGTAERPRLSVFRSSKHIYAQIIDDIRGITLVAAGTLGKAMAEKIPYGGNIKAAETIGSLLAEQAKAKGIEKVAFDRGSYKFHGRVKALADAAREGGLQF